VLKSFEFNTIKQASAANVQTRIVQAQNPTWHWTLIYDYLKDYVNDILPGFTDTDFRTLLGFMLARQGMFDDFLYDDPYDNSVGPGLLPTGGPNLGAQLQLVQDPTTGIWYSPVQRLMGGQFYEDVTDLYSSGISAFANGITKVGGGMDYTLLGPGLAIPGYSFCGPYLKWTGTPTPPITAEFNFYFRVCFEMDDQDFEQFMQFLWTIGGGSSKNGSGMLKLVTARTANL
jgi:hypothetical protein